MKVEMSRYLIENKQVIKKLVDDITKEFKYVSILGTDSNGTSYTVMRTGASISDSMWCERGFVVRVYNGINYSEFSFNNIDETSYTQIADEIKTKVRKQLEEMKKSPAKIENYELIDEEEWTDSFNSEVELLPEKVSAKDKLTKMNTIMEKALKYSDSLVDFRISYTEVHVSKIFVSSKKDLQQSYVFTEGYMIPIVRRGEDTKYAFEGFSGLKGVELLDEMSEKTEKVIDETEKLLDAEKIVPGEYDVICTPKIAGLIAHEAFGHGVEMDMVVKGRAKSVEYFGKPIASKLVKMHDGAAAAYNMSSYLFDDEGTRASDTVIINEGILESGISDLLSALKLKIKPTGNGKRQSFERKVYARMTNTFFESGKDNLEDMIASIKFGYLLDSGMSGMEDPKNWGIQCMLLKGFEIKDGKLTGKMVSPIVMTGYVPDLLNSISMVSKDVNLFGTGACGKGYKEFVKVSDGGPYLKAKARLG